MKHFICMAWRAPAVLFVLLSVLCAARNAEAYPQFAFKGYGTCNACHHSPSGGGLPNRYGLDTLDVTFGAGSSGGWGNQDLSYDASAPAALKVDLGLDVRLLPLFVADSDGTVATLVPMLAELGGAAAWGPFTVYGTATAKKPGGSGPSYVVASREHWLKYSASSAFDVRVGRLVLPFGIRQPDHTQYVREDFEFDKYDQSYALEGDFVTTDWAVFASVFAGGLTGAPKERQERGGMLTGIRELSGGSALGVSALGSLSTARRRFAGSLFGRARLGPSMYALAELAAQQFAARDGDATLSTIAEYVRLGWFAKPEMDVFLEGGHRAFLNADALVKERIGLGLNWQVLRWFEFAHRSSLSFAPACPCVRACLHSCIACTEGSVRAKARG
jgi:hypothetical protein